MPEQTLSDALAGLSGQELARARRAMLSQTGKKGLGLVTRQSVAASRPASHATPADAAPARDATPPAIASTIAAPVLESAPESVAESVAESFTEAALDIACTLVESGPAAAQAVAGESEMGVRDFCRERRKAMSILGKGALPAKSSSSASSNLAGLSGQELARKRRAELSSKGRGNAPAPRPSGRVRPPVEVPAKVETGTTLSGQTVSGTQVERTSRVTGNEPGTCRAITGTEYIGSEQFEAFCQSSPEPAPAKVGMSATSHGRWVTGAPGSKTPERPGERLESGTELGRTLQVTGGEVGMCKPVTGTEYLGSENFTEYCEGKGLIVRPEKVSVGTTARKGLAISGSDAARPRAVTGEEAGAKRSITGSQYADAGSSRLTINGPSKVALTHTVAGRPVSGVEVGRSIKVTGDEAGACKSISGTEYLSNEQFETVCHGRSEQVKPQARPEKVGEAASQAGQRITGNLVERTQKVTGNEPRAEGRVTGSQYERGGVKGEAPAKVREMRTLVGHMLTGGVLTGARFPKLSGDEQGGCQSVTGTEYAGAERFSATCAAEPARENSAPASKVVVTHTRHGMAVSGTPLGMGGQSSSRVTGDEPGSRLAISGTPYAASEQIQGACGCQHGDQGARQAAPALPSRFQPPGRPSSQPRAMAMTRRESEPRPAAFSVAAPAQEAAGRITGTGYGGAGRITGPVNMASGLVSGTPEFRYRDEPRQGFNMAAPAPVPVPVPAPEAITERITGEGRDGGTRITGDDWARSERVTGTEGRWAQGRNPTMRGGEGRGLSAGAWANKDRERPEAPIGRVTGSSGNAGKGAAITLSGGARG